MKIVYLYTEIMPYVDVVFNEIAEQGHSVIAFYKDKTRQTPYNPREIDGVEYFKESEYSSTQLFAFVKQNNPDILVVAGWSYKKYLYVAKSFYGLIPVVCPIDTQYLGSFKQKMGILFSFYFVRRYFSHIWVPGVRQYHFARLLGYKPNKIIMNSLTGNISLFGNIDINLRTSEYPKSFLYVGRYHEAKGLDILIEAWNSIKDKCGWSLITVGNGPLEGKLKECEGIKVLGFKNQEELANIAVSSGVFILPSIYEPWALVLHEFTAAGLPIICSDACGASPHFVISGYNGYVFSSGSSLDLKTKMERIMALPDEELLAMSKRSRRMSSYTNPEMSTYSLLSVLE